MVDNSSMIPRSSCDLLSKLEYLSMIQRGHKPCFNDLSLVSTSSWRGAFKRFRNRENRKTMIIQVNQIVDLAIDTIGEYSNTKYTSFIVETLSNAKIGISNLLFTYQDDPNVVSQVKVIISKINNKINQYRSISGPVDDKQEDKKVIEEDKPRAPKGMDNKVTLQLQPKQN